MLGILCGHLFVDDCADAGVRPYVFRGFDHVDNGVNRQDYAKDFDWRPDAGHKREGKKIASHGDSGIADGGDDGNEEPENKRGHIERHPAVLHDKEGRYQNERSAPVHVNRAAYRQHKTGDLLFCFQVVFRGFNGHRQCCRGAFCEEGHEHGREHAAKNPDRVNFVHQQKQWQDDKELNEVSSEYHCNVFAEGAKYEPGRNLSGKLCGKSEDSERQSPDETFDHGEEDFLHAENAFQKYPYVFRFLFDGENKSDGERHKQDAKDVP